MSDTWFITGAAGFIGSNLCVHLCAAGATVVGFDDFSAGTAANVARIEAAASGAFTLVEGDIRDADAVRRAMPAGANVVHLAAQVSVPKSIDDPGENNTINVDGFLNTLMAAGDAGAPGFVYASSCAVYGDSPNLPLAESETPQPLSPYAATKVLNEHYARTLSPSYPDMRTVGLRFFNVFGPWQGFDGGYASVIPRWLHMILNGERPKIFGDGLQTRDFVFVSNICEAVERAARQRPEGDPVFNVCTGLPVDLRGLHEAMIEECAAAGVNIAWSEPEFLPARAGDILHSHGSAANLQTTLGAPPPVSLAEGIRTILRDQYERGVDTVL